MNCTDGNSIYPNVEINLGKIKQNIEVVLSKCQKIGIEPIAVVKAMNGSKEIVETMVDNGIRVVGDSRLDNIREYQDIDVKIMMIRIPMLSEAKSIVETCDISLNSEIKIIRQLSIEATKLGRNHEIILMLELGDLREGIYSDDELYDTIREIISLEGIKLKGIGVNFNCFGGIKPSEDKLLRLVSIKNSIQDKFNIKLDTISGGSSGSISLIDDGVMPREINELRIGTTFLIGIIEGGKPKLKNTYSDAFKLRVEIIELKNKPSKPYGDQGLNLFRIKPEFKDIGIRKRAICAIGKQDCDPMFMYPEDEKVKIIGASSDHLILDVTDSKLDYQVGNNIVFTLDYISILRVMTSKHVKKIYKY